MLYIPSTWTDLNNGVLTMISKVSEPCVCKQERTFKQALKVSWVSQ